MSCVGFFLIWTATDVGRRPESEIKMFSIEFLVQLGLMVIGSSLISYYG